MPSERSILETCACGKVRMAARALTRRYDDALRPAGLRATQFALLVGISANGAQSIAALAKELGMDRSTLTRNIRPMLDEGLLALGDEGWRRSRALELTRKGRSRMEQAIPYWESAQKALKRRLGDRHWEVAHEGLDRLIEVE